MFPSRRLESAVDRVSAPKPTAAVGTGYCPTPGRLRPTGSLAAD
ncbi:hypothetical protein C486_13327 [Natrinema gari JCM 14663]|uniref:Uncharacterized protein n=1 Tax=Natrinema gari JCM 14663 TaxID=1230459 RepID=L9YWA8_9EURY|nr:hypothetical protein C486_13327 [Natrinema gari JCM 14663]